MALIAAVGPTLPLELIDKIFQIASRRAATHRELDFLVLCCPHARRTIRRPTDVQLFTGKQINQLLKLAASFSAVFPYSLTQITFADLELIELLVPTRKAEQMACLKIFNSVKIRELNICLTDLTLPYDHMFLILLSWTPALKDLQVLRVKYDWSSGWGEDESSAESSAAESGDDSDAEEAKRAADLSEVVRKRTLDAFKASVELQGLPVLKKRKLR
ncbi:unnamed protein product [Cyclocybe aegerita]|uniref:Uncharacterized protein n=1 Tax=Cyclocybe aegerita TaxID=1973307 RepID=A0A8S0W0S3_CYCAE|nr:unnamed protein product [Cyclocybe aegerita]